MAWQVTVPDGQAGREDVMVVLPALTALNVVAPAGERIAPSDVGFFQPVPDRCRVSRPPAVTQTTPPLSESVMVTELAGGVQPCGAGPEVRGAAGGRLAGGAAAEG